MAGRDPETLAREFAHIVDRPRRWPVTYTLAHFSISLAPGEALERPAIAAISRALLQAMGHQRCPYFAVQHHDQTHKQGVLHWHVVTSTLTPAGDWVSDLFSKRRLKHIERDLEAQFGLRPSPSRPAAQRHNLTTGEHRRKARTGEVLPKEKLWAAIDAAARDHPTLPLFILRLQAQGVEVSLRRQHAQYMGISFSLDGAAFAGRRLGPAYSLGGLQQHKGLYYDPDTHDAPLTQLLAQSTRQAQAALTDYEARQAQRQARYTRYAHHRQGDSEAIDRQVARLALSEGLPPEEVVALLRLSPKAQAIRQQHGHLAHLTYCHHLTQTAISRPQSRPDPYQSSPSQYQR